jgi:large subunit ribosomal protein L29
MKAGALRELSVEELKSRENDLRKEIFELRIRHNTGVLESTAQLRGLRRNLARVLTVQQELTAKQNQEHNDA